MKRLTYRDRQGKAHLTNYGNECLNGSYVDSICAFEDLLIPRVLSSVEICELADGGYKYPIVFVETNEINLKETYPVWFEGYAEPVESDETEIHLYAFGEPEPFEAKWRDYGKIWRCWNKEPSEKQKKETQWYEGEKDETEN